MPLKNVHIVMTQRGFAVTSGESTATFQRLDDAVDFARARLRLAMEIREISLRVE